MRSQKTDEKLLVVLGATGNQGNAVLRYFANSPSDHGYKLRGISRNVESNASKQLIQLGVEMVEADLDDVAGLKKAFSGATHIFANTDSNAIILNALQTPDLLPQGQTLVSYAHDIELARGKNIAEAAASTDTLQRLIWSSIVSPKRWSHGRYTEALMWDVKEEIADFLTSKPALQCKMSTLLVGIYATMPIIMPQLYAPQKQADGMYELALYFPGDMRLPLADLESDIGKWVSALFEADPGISLVGATEVLTYRKWLEKWASHNGVTARFRHCSDKEISSKLPELSGALLEIAAFLKDYGFTGGNSEVIYPADLRRQGIEITPSSIDHHISRTDWSSIL